MEIGDKVPELLGVDQDGKEVKMSDFISIQKITLQDVLLKPAACATDTPNLLKKGMR